MNHLPQTHTDILILVGFFLQLPPGLLLSETLLKTLQNIDVGELALIEPRMRDNSQPLPQHTKGLGAVGDDYHGFLNGRARHILGTVDE